MSNVQPATNDPNVSTVADSDSSEHVVQAGESLATLSQQYGIPARTLHQANPQVVNPNALSPGQTLTIPTNTQTASAQNQQSKASLFDGTRVSYNPTLSQSQSKANQHSSGDKAKGKISVSESGVAIGVSKQNTSEDETTTQYGTGKTSSDKSQGFSLTSEKNGLGINVNQQASHKGEFKNSQGYGVSYEVGGGASVSAKHTTDNGITTYTNSVDVSVNVKYGASTPYGGFKQGKTEGAKAEFEVSLPQNVAASTQLEDLNPFQPDALPEGTSIRLDGSRYTTNEFSATFKNLSMQTKVTDETGVSVSIEKVDANKVTVTAGPTEAIKAYNGFGLDLKGFSATAGVSNTLGNSTLKTATFDITTSQGRAAYNDFLSNGQLPSTSSAGVTDIRTTEKLTLDSTSKVGVKVHGFELSAAGIKVGGFDLSQEIASNTGSVVQVTEEDGSSNRIATVQYGNNPPLTVNQSFDAAGNELVDDQTISYKVVLDGPSADSLNQTFGNLESTQFEAGQTVDIEFSPAQAEKFSQSMQTYGEKYPGSLPQSLTSKDKAPLDTLIYVAKNASSEYSLITKMYEYVQYGTADHTQLKKVDATIHLN